MGFEPKVTASCATLGRSDVYCLDRCIDHAPPPINGIAMANLSNQLTDLFSRAGASPVIGSALGISSGGCCPDDATGLGPGVTTGVGSGTGGGVGGNVGVGVTSGGAARRTLKLSVLQLLLTKRLSSSQSHALYSSPRFGVVP